MTTDTSNVTGGVSILVPTLNEAENMAPLFAAITDAIGTRFPYEILVIDDGSTDGTRERVLDAGDPVRLLARDNPTGGLTGAVVDGAKDARFDTVVIIDGDRSHPASVIPDLVAPVLDGSRDVTVGSRHVPGGGMPGWPFYRRFVSKVAAWMAWPLVDVRDPMSGFLAMRRERLMQVDPEAQGFKVGLEVMAAGRDRVRVAEVPIVFQDRQWGESKLKGSTIVAYLVRLVALAGGRAGAKSVRLMLAATAFGLVADLMTMKGLLAAGQPIATVQVLGAGVAFACAYLLNSRWLPDPGVGGVRRFLRGVSVGLLAEAMRAGVLAAGATPEGAASNGLLVVAAAVFAVVSHVGNVFYVFARDPGSGRRLIRWRVAAVGVATYSLFLRLVYAGATDLVPEEAYYWTYAQHPALSYLDHPPMIAWLTWLGTAVFGNNEFGVRVPAIACGVLAAFFIYRLTLNLFDKASAIVAALLMICLPYFFAAGFLAAPDAPLLALWAGALFFFERALVGNRSWGWWGAGVCVGLGLLSKYTMVLIGPAAALFMIVHPAARRWWRRPEPYLGGVIALLLFSPVLIWNARHEWASFLFQSSRRVADESEFTTVYLLFAALVMLTPLGCGAAIRAMRRPIADGQPEDRQVARRRFALVFTCVPLSVFVVFSLTKSAKGYWTGPPLLGMIPAIAAMILYSTNVERARRLSRQWAATVTVTLIVLAGVLQYSTLGFPGVGYRAGLRVPVGWREMGETVERIEAEVHAATGAWPRVVGINKYTLAAETNFYRQRPGRLPSLSGHLFGRAALMFEVWASPEEGVGQPLVLVSFEHADLVAKAVIDQVQRSDPVVEHSITRYGHKVGKFFTRVVYGYRAPG